MSLKTAISATSSVAGPNLHGNADRAGKASFIWCFTHPRTLKRAVRVALVVGPILGFINHFDLLLGAAFTMERLAKIAVTFLVPFSVSAFSSANAMLDGQRKGYE